MVFLFEDLIIKTDGKEKIIDLRNIYLMLILLKGKVIY